MKGFRPVLFAALCSGLVLRADAQIQINGGGTINFTPGAAQPETPILNPRPRLSAPRASFDMTLTAEENDLVTQATKIQKTEGFTVTSLPKLTAIFETLYKEQVKSHGPEHPVLISTTQFLISFYHREGNVEKELQWARVRHELVRKVVADINPSAPEGKADMQIITSQALSDLIRALCAKGLLKEAEPHVKDALPLFEDPSLDGLALRSTAFGWQDASHFRHEGMEVLADYYRRISEKESAEKWRKRADAFAAQHVAKTAGKNSPAIPYDAPKSDSQKRLESEALGIMTREGITPDSMPRLIALYERDLEELKASRGADHPFLVSPAILLMNLYVRVGDKDRQLQVARLRYEVVKKAVAKFTATHEIDSTQARNSVCQALSQLIRCLCAEGLLEEAAPYVEEALPLFQDASLDDCTVTVSLAEVQSRPCRLSGLEILAHYYRLTANPEAEARWKKRAEAYAAQYLPELARQPPSAGPATAPEKQRMEDEAREIFIKWSNQQVTGPEAMAVLERLYETSEKNNGVADPLSVRLSRSLFNLARMTNDAPNEAKWALLRYQVSNSTPSAAHTLAGQTTVQLNQCVILGDLIHALCWNNQMQEAGVYVPAAEALFREPRIEHTLVSLSPPGSDNLISYHQGLLGIGLYYGGKGDSAAAEPWLKRSLRFAKDHQLDQISQSRSLVALAGLYEGIRDYRRAEPLRLEAYEANRKTIGEEALSTIEALKHLGWNYNKQGRQAEAEKCIRESLRLARSRFPERVNMVNETSGMLADVLYHEGKSKEAGELYKTTLAGFEKTGATDRIATTSFNQGLYLAGQNRPAEAEKDFQKALEYWDQLDNRANDDVRDRALSYIALAQWRQGKKDTAQETARRWVRGFDSRLANVLSFTDEDQRMAWLSWQWPFNLTAFMDMDEETAQMLLRTKGIVLDSIMEDRAVARLDSSGPAHADWEALKKVRDEIRQVQAFGKKMDTAALVKLEEKESELQGGLARAGVSAGQTRASLSVTLAELQGALPKDAAFLDYFRYSYSDDAAKREVWHYGVVVHRPGQRPKLVRLTPPAEEIDNMIGLFIHTMHRPPAKPRDKDQALETLMKLLYTELIESVAPELDGAATLILSPDNVLDSLPFATLMDAQGKFLCEHFTLRQVNSARDLIADPSSPPATGSKTFALYGGPNYRLAHTGSAAPSSGGLRQYTDQMVRGQYTLLRPLPEAAREAEQLAKRAASDGWHIDLHTGDDATETSVRAINSPDVLHIITHGYFMKRLLDRKSEDAIRLMDVDGKPERMRTLFDPMQRSGLFLAGAEDTFDQWRQGKSYKEDSDGVLTAAEACALNLRGTWLVTLDACDTGEGDIVAGEGVMGLRRAFTFAGARNVMMSLWPITPITAIGLVDDFYVKALASHDAADALNQVERDWLPRMKKDRGLWEAIEFGGPLILVGMGR